tara:strand:+ start:168 stop:488 length:321 start_codon:yes stop_codon:yes gene_type:complete
MDDFTHFFEHVMGVQRLKWSGEQGKSLCPFHDNKTPSLSVNRKKGIYFCFSCGAKGNAYTYAKENNIDNPRQYVSNSEYRPQEYIPVNTIKAMEMRNQLTTDITDT